MIYNASFIKEKKEFVIDVSKFHVGCAYFVQNNEHGGSWFVGILDDVSEDSLNFVVRKSNMPERIILDDLINPDNGYKITLLVPGHDEVVDMAKQQDPIGFGRYMKEL